MSVDVRYANKVIRERLVYVLNTYFNDEIDNLTLSPITLLPDNEAVVSSGFGIDTLKKQFSDLNISQTAIFIEQSGPAVFNDEFSCGIGVQTRQRVVPMKITLIQKVEIAIEDVEQPVSTREMLVPEIATIRGDLYGGLIEYVISKYAKDDGTSIYDVATTQSFNAGIGEPLPDFGTLLYVEVEFSVYQDVEYAV